MSDYLLWCIALSAAIQGTRPKNATGEIEQMICSFCGYDFPDECGFYGCPNCEAEGLEKYFAPRNYWGSGKWFDDLCVFESIKIGVKCFLPSVFMRTVATKHYRNRGFRRFGKNPFGIIDTCTGNLALQLFNMENSYDQYSASCV